MRCASPPARGRPRTAGLLGPSPHVYPPEPAGNPRRLAAGIASPSDSPTRLDPKPPHHRQPVPSTPAPLVCGVLGGIASGKSEVARLLAGDDGVVLDADREVAGLYDDAGFRSELRAAFGPEVLAKDGTVDRAQLADRAFGSSDQRRRLEALVHPRVRARLASQLERARAEGRPVIVLDVPLLLENETEHRLPEACDALIFVDAPPAERDARAVARRGWASGEVARREALQMPLEQKRARAQHVIHNDGDRAGLERSVRELRARLCPRSR